MCVVDDEASELEGVAYGSDELVEVGCYCRMQPAEYFRRGDVEYGVQVEWPFELVDV